MRHSLALAVAVALVAMGLTRAPSLAGVVVPAISDKHLVYVADAQDNRIDIYGRGGKPMGHITKGINYPQGLYVDASGILYVANRGAGNVLAFRRGEKSAFATFADGMEQPEGVTVCPDGSLYVANILSASGGSGDITVYANGSRNPTGTLTYTGGYFFYLACDASGNLFATIVYGSTGTVLAFPNAQQGGVTQLPITYGGNPDGIAVDAAQNLLVPYGNGVVEFTESGNPTGVQIPTVGLSQIALDATGRFLIGAAGSAADLYAIPKGTHLHTYAAGGSVTGAAMDPGLY
jgi:DNA-binding beta-propeller fold protein YncE